MATDITQPSATTSPLQNLATGLATQNIAGTTQPVSAGQATGAYQAAANFGAGEQSYLNQTQQNLTNQSGIPGIESQYNNLGQVFQMYQADQNLSHQYTSSSLGTPNSPIYQGNLSPSNTSWNSNPYLNESPSQLLSNVVAPMGNGFQGFSNPQDIQSAVGEVPSAVSNIMSTLQNLYTGTSGLVQNQLGVAQNQYETQANTLNLVANLLSGANASQQASALTNSASNISSGILSSLPSNNTPAENAQSVQDNKASIIQQYIQQYVNNGMSPQEAKANATTFVNNLISQLSTGALTGTKAPTPYKGTKETASEAAATAGATNTPWWQSVLGILSPTAASLVPSATKNTGNTTNPNTSVVNPSWQASQSSPYTIVSVGQ